MERLRQIKRAITGEHPEPLKGKKEEAIVISSDEEEPQSVRTVDSDDDDDEPRRPKPRRRAVASSDEDDEDYEETEERQSAHTVRSNATPPRRTAASASKQPHKKPPTRRRAVASSDEDEDEEYTIESVLDDDEEEEVISVPSAAPSRVAKKPVNGKPSPPKASSSKPSSSSKPPSSSSQSPFKPATFKPYQPPSSTAESSYPLLDVRRKVSGLAQPPQKPVFAINPPQNGATPVPRAPPPRMPGSLSGSHLRDAERDPAFELYNPRTGSYLPPSRSSGPSFPEPMLAPGPSFPEPMLAPDGTEVFDMNSVPAGMDWEAPQSAAAVEQEMHNLLAGVAAHEENTTVDMTQALVPGLAKGVVLKPHQVLSRQWMREREDGKKRGGILADDMGLGKTIQIIVRIHEGRTEGQAPTLIVVPTSVVTQWAQEIAKFAPRLKVTEHHGPSRTRSVTKLKAYDVVVTSYPIVQSEHKNHTDIVVPKQTKLTSTGRQVKAQDPMDVLFRIEFYRVVLDEAHTIKNRLAKTCKACLDLRSAKRWCLTGTPLQNNVDELYPLFAFIGLKPLDDWDQFKTKISDPVKKGKTKGAMNRLQVVLKPTMLRRLKTDMLDGKPLVDLPARVVETVNCEFDSEERAFYNALQDKMELAFNKFMDAGTVMNNYTAVLTLLLRLRQACNHPKLVTKDFAKGDAEALEARPAENRDLPEPDAADDLVQGLASLGIGRQCKICLTPLPQDHADGTCADCARRIEKEQRRAAESTTGPSSAKIRKVMELLRQIQARGEGDEKTIVFSQFTSWFNIAEAFLVEEGIRFTRLDGSMTKPDREKALEKIKTSKRTNVILVSFKAGSTGLNLTCCNNVILVDLWWNPALEEQAFDRAHRLGQERDVNIYKLTIKDTVEDRILQLQDTKRALAKAALSGEKMKGNKLNMNDLIKLFRGGADDEDGFD